MQLGGPATAPGRGAGRGGESRDSRLVSSGSTRGINTDNSTRMKIRARDERGCARGERQRVGVHGESPGGAGSLGPPAYTAQLGGLPAGGSGGGASALRYHLATASSAAPAPGSDDAVTTASLEEACELREGQLTLYASAHKARTLVQAARAHRAAQQRAAAAEYLNGESPTLMGIQPSRASRKNN